MRRQWREQRALTWELRIALSLARLRAAQGQKGAAGPENRRLLVGQFHEADKAHWGPVIVA